MRAHTCKVKLPVIHDAIKETRGLFRRTTAAMHSRIDLQVEMQQQVQLHREFLQAVEVVGVMHDEVDLPGSNPFVEGIHRGYMPDGHEDENRQAAGWRQELGCFTRGIDGEHSRTRGLHGRHDPVCPEAISIRLDDWTERAVWTDDLAQSAEIAFDCGKIDVKSAQFIHGGKVGASMLLPCIVYAMILP